MNTFLFLIIIGILIDLENKISKIIDKGGQRRYMNPNEVKKLIGKTVCLHIENDNINDSYLFSSITNTKGKVKECDREWVRFEYETKQELVSRYFRISDISSIDELD